MRKLAIGVDIGGTRTKVGLVDIDNGEVFDQLIYPTETKSSEVFLAQMKDAIHTFKEKVKATSEQIKGIGFGIPGFIFPNGMIDTTYGSVDFMEYYPLKQLIEDEHQITCALDNDARVIALGESLYGIGKDYKRVLVLTLGTGVGVGFTIEGKLNEPLAFAHMAGHITITDNEYPCYCGRTGCLESLVSATGMCQLAKRAGWEKDDKNAEITAEYIFKQREIGNPLAVKLVDQYINYLKTGIDNYANIYAPDVVILGGGVAKGLVNDLHKLHNKSLLFPYQTYKTDLKTSILEESSGILGAAALLN